MKRLLSSFLALTLVACYSIETRSWGEWIAYDPQQVDAAPAASFSWARWPGMVSAIDGHSEVSTGYKQARLSPSRHTVEYSNYAHSFGHVTGEILLDLEAGHRYEFQFATCYWCTPRQFRVWVEDSKLGKVVWGNPPTWPRWFL